MARASLHGVVGGTVAEIQGGKFATGFAASFATHAAGGAIKSGLEGADKYTRSIAAGVVGGTISKATGGKFANAAVTSGFQWLFNAEGDHAAQTENNANTDTATILMAVDPETGQPLFVPVDSEFKPIFVPEGFDIHANADEADGAWNPFWFRKKVRNGGDWDYKQGGSQFEALGNFNYGFTGSAFGFPDEFLLRQAGLAQIKAGTLRPQWQIRRSPRHPLMPPYGDDPRDQLMIRAGIDALRSGIRFSTVEIQ